MPHSVDVATLEALETMPMTPAIKAAREWRRAHERVVVEVEVQRVRRLGLLLGMRAEGLTFAKITELTGEPGSRIRNLAVKAKDKGIEPIPAATYEWFDYHLRSQVAQAELKLLRESRERLISKLRAEGLTIAQAAHLMGISVHTVYQVIAAHDEAIAS